MSEETENGSMEHGVFHRCIQTDNVEGLKITVGALERSLYDMEKTTGETLERLESKVDAITQTIENNGLKVKINNNGIEAQVKLGDIIQFFLDRPSAQVKKVETVLNRIVDASKDVVWIFGAILMIIYAISAVMHLPRP